MCASDRWSWQVEYEKSGRKAGAVGPHRQLAPPARARLVVALVCQRATAAVMAGVVVHIGYLTGATVIKSAGSAVGVRPDHNDMSMNPYHKGNAERKQKREAAHESKQIQRQIKVSMKLNEYLVGRECQAVADAVWKGLSLRQFHITTKRPCCQDRLGTDVQKSQKRGVFAGRPRRLPVRLREDRGG